MDYLHEGLIKLGFLGDSLTALEEKLNKYIDELLLFNRRHRMVNTDDRDEVIIRHVLDCLSAYTFMQDNLNTDEGGSIVDVGSGAGFPAIPLACAMPFCRFTLIERMENRGAFLLNAISILRLNNAEVGQYDANNSPRRHYADITTSRAYSPLDKKSLVCYKTLTKDGGLVALYKTPLEAKAAETFAVKDYCVTPITVPFMEERERCIVSFRF